MDVNVLPSINKGSFLSFPFLLNVTQRIKIIRSYEIGPNNTRRFKVNRNI